MNSRIPLPVVACLYIKKQFSQTCNDTLVMINLITETNHSHMSLLSLECSIPLKEAASLLWDFTVILCGR